MDIRKAVKKDLPAINGIYNQAVHTTTATFDTEDPVMVADLDGKIVAWASLSRFSDRKAYDETSEISIYVGEAHRSQGIGKFLLRNLIAKSEENKIWTLQAGIFPENIPSLKIHQQLGFRQVGYREKIGQMSGIWRDTVLLERRSKVVGIATA